MPRHPDPELEKRILTAASRLWARGGEKKLTMRAIATAAETTTPTVYERYRDRADILRALRLQTRRELFAALNPTRTLTEAVQEYLNLRYTTHTSMKFCSMAWAGPSRMNRGHRSTLCANDYRAAWGYAAAAQPLDSGHLVAYAWNGDADHSRRVRRSTACAGGTRLPGYCPGDRSSGETAKIIRALRSEVAHDSGFG